jgi:predicted ATPase
VLVAISGSQSSGKSTILNEIKKLGYPIVERKTSRSILSDWNVTLQEVNSNPKLTVDFQHEILARKIADEQEAVDSPDLWFGERTFADLFTYALVSIGKDNQYDSWLTSYYKECMVATQSYSLVYYLRAGRFAVDHDGVRGSNRHYSRLVDIAMLDITQQMVLSGKLTTIETPDLEQRVSIITTQSHALLRRGLK